MIFENQSNPLVQLKLLANEKRQSVLIDGPAGCGKSYLARQYAEMLGISDIVEVKPSVQDIRDAVELGYQIQVPLMLCIENLDTGVASASHALLKFLEEPMPNVYIVVTCRNIRKVPDTILSRSSVVSVSPPIVSDIDLYAQSLNASKHLILKSSPIWKAVRSFKDVVYVFGLTDAQIHYYTDALSKLTFKDTVSNIVWALSHYEEGGDIDIEFMLRYLLSLKLNDASFRNKCMESLRDLELNRLSTHAILSKFAFECKYGE